MMVLCSERFHVSLGVELPEERELITPIAI
jgi:hypothetical protein